MTELYWKRLSNLLRDKKKHDVGLALDVAPFLSKRSKAIRQRFPKVLGEYIRNVCNYKFDMKKLKSHEFSMSSNENPFSEHIAEEVEFKTEEDKYDFIRFLDRYMFNEDEIKLIHPHLFNYIDVEKKPINEFSKYGKFIYDTLVTNSKKEFNNIFNEKESEDILTDLILNQMNTLTGTEEKALEYQPLLNSFAKTYQEDVMYLSEYRDYFLSSFPLLTHFYVFMYICQLIVKFERFEAANYNSLEPLYFSLEWEALSKRRSAVDDHNSFNFINSNQKNLFPHIHTLSQLSHNSYNKKSIEQDKPIEVITYSKLINLIEENKLNEKKFYEELKLWIKEYIKWSGIEYFDTSKNISEAIRVLFKCVRRGTNSEVSKKFGANLEDLGANQFIKSRGSLGRVLNIKHDFLLLLTAVSVKNQRMPLQDLFMEFERRGVTLDRYSKKEVIEMLNKLNIIDKKSDSGDAQYVKPIL